MTKALFAEFTARPGTEPEVARLVRQLAVRVRTEPGNLVFDVYRRPGDGRAFFVYEVYRDDAAFAEHLRADYGLEFNRALAELIEQGESQLTMLDPV